MTRDVELEITGKEEGLDAALSRAQASVASSVRQMEGAFAGLSGIVSRLQGLFAGITATLAGGAVFGAAVTATVNLAKESQSLGRELGISATQASILKVALGDVYATSDQLNGATSKIAQTLNKNEDAFGRLGVATRDSNGNFRGTLDILLDVNTKLSEFKEGTDRNVAGVQIFGKSWAELEPLIRLNADAMEKARAKAEELGLAVGVEDVAATQRYRAAMNDVGDVVDALKKAIGDELLPSLTEAAEWFAEHGPQALAITRFAVAALEEAWVRVSATFLEFGERIGSRIAWLGQLFTTLGDVVRKVMNLDFSGAAAAWEQGMAGLDAIVAARVERVVEIQRDARERIDAIWDRAAQPINAGKTPLAEPAGGGASPGTATTDGNQLAGLRATLDAQKVAWQEQQRAEGSFREFSKQQEAAYWRDVLATRRLSANDQIAVRRQVSQLELAIDKERFGAEIAGLAAQQAEFKKDGEARLAIAKEIADRMKSAYGEDSVEYQAARRQVVDTERQIAEQLKSIHQVESANQAAAAMASIDDEEEIARLRTSINLQTEKQLLQQEMAFEDRRAEIRRRALREQLEIAQGSPDRDPVEIARLQALLEEQEREHLSRMGKIRRKAVQEQNREWLQAQRKMESGFSDAIAQMIKGQKSFADGMRAMASSVANAVIDMIAQIAAQWLVQQIAQLVGMKATGAATIATKAGEAGAAGVASWAGAPWPVNMGAPAFGAAMFAAAMAYMPSVAAEQGFDVPSGLAPIAQLHPREMVLPAELADVVRGMSRGGRGGSGDIHVHVVDATGMQRLLKRNSRAVASTVTKQAGKAFRRIR